MNRLPQATLVVMSITSVFSVAAVALLEPGGCKPNCADLALPGVVSLLDAAEPSGCGPGCAGGFLRTFLTDIFPFEPGGCKPNCLGASVGLALILLAYDPGGCSPSC